MRFALVSPFSIGQMNLINDRCSVLSASDSQACLNGRDVLRTLCLVQLSHCLYVQNPNMQIVHNRHVSDC